MKKKRKYVRRELTDDVIIKEITRIRTKNNKQWMQMLRLAYAAKPRAAASIMNEIVANDQAVTKWMQRLGNHA